MWLDYTYCCSDFDYVNISEERAWLSLYEWQNTSNYSRKECHTQLFTHTSRTSKRFIAQMAYIIHKHKSAFIQFFLIDSRWYNQLEVHIRNSSFSVRITLSASCSFSFKSLCCWFGTTFIHALVCCYLSLCAESPLCRRSAIVNHVST